MATIIKPKRKPRKKSVLKAIRQTERRAAVNRANRSRLRTDIKNLRAALAAGNVEKARELLPATLSAIDQSIQKGVLHRNTAARYKSRLRVRWNSLAAQSPSAAD